MIKREENRKLNNQGMTLIELVICFALLGLLMVAGAQVIASSTQIYYYAKATDYGMQASQVIATEIRGDIENAIIKPIEKTKSGAPFDDEIKWLYITPNGDSIFFVNQNGEQVSYTFENDISTGKNLFVRKAYKAYDNMYNAIPVTDFGNVEKRYYTTKYVGMNYSVKDVNFSILQKNSDSSVNKLPISDYIVIVLIVTVENPHYGEYECTEYIPLYNFAGLKAISNLESYITGPYAN